MSAIHKRLYAAMKKEFKLLSKIVSQYLPPEYPYDVVGGARNIKQLDFDDRVDVYLLQILIYFQCHKELLWHKHNYNLQHQIHRLHNLYQVYRKMYEAIGVKDVDQVLPPPAPMHRWIQV